MGSVTSSDGQHSSSVADHGRDQYIPSTSSKIGGGGSNSNLSGLAATRPGFGRSQTQAKSEATPVFVREPESTLMTPASAQQQQPRSHEGSMSSNEARPNTLAVPGGSGAASGSNSATGNRVHDPAGTRTPGGAVAGKAGSMMPLSIIGDLQARQSQLGASTTPSSTPGDLERHHPFGGGAVTPFRGGQTPGLAPRTPGQPSGAVTPGAANKGFQNSLTGRTIPGLSMTKANDLASANKGSRPGDATPARPSPFLRSDGAATSSSSAGARPPLSRAGSKATATALAGGTFNDHGRGMEISKTPPKPLDSSSPTTDSDREASLSALEKSRKHVSYAGASKSSSIEEQASTGDFSREHRLRRRSHSNVPPSSSSASFGRSTSRIRLNRTASMMSNKTRNRRTSVDTLSTFAEDLGLDDEDNGYMSSSYEPVSAESMELPPHDFVPNPSSNGGLVNAIASLSHQRQRPGGGKMFVGCPGLSSDEEWLSEKHRASLDRRFRDERSSVPIWVEGETFKGAYRDFCKRILWPTFHYTLPSDKALEGEHEAFEAYQELNMAFAHQLAEEWREGDIILINDYHLLLVPQMLRELVPSATIGLFVHIAFPSSELFRCLAMRETLLRGMLGADLVGFQTHNFCRHFRQTVSRILQLEATPKGVQAETFFTTVSSFPIGIDPRNLNAKRADPEVAEWVAKLTERYQGKKVIVGRDKLDWIRGVRQKLLAFEVFLQDHPEWVGRVVFVQVALATNEENEEAGSANEVVSRINAKYSSLTYQPVVFLHVQDITFSQYLALLTVADGFLANSLREGMNLTTHEYVVCQDQKQSPLILSEFTGSYSALRAAIGINPWNAKQVAQAIHKALTMSPEEQRARWTDLHRTVVTQTSLQWITSLLSRLERAHIEQQRRDNAFIPRLEIGTLVSEWRASKTRLILLDLEGSLLNESILLLRNSEDFEIPQQVLETLKELSEDPRNAIYLLSSLSTKYLDRISETLPRMGIVAEDGCAVKHPGGPIGSWISLIAGLNHAWKLSVMEILRYFQDRTPGSFLHDRGATLFFSSTGQSEEDNASDSEMSGATRIHLGCSTTKTSNRTRTQESQWARRQLAEINNLVYDSLGERFSLRIIPRGTTLTVMPKNVSRASAVQHIVQLQAMGVLNRVASGGSAAPTTGFFGAQGAAAAAAATNSRNSTAPSTPGIVMTPEVEKDAFEPAARTMASSQGRSTDDPAATPSEEGRRFSSNPVYSRDYLLQSPSRAAMNFSPHHHHGPHHQSRPKQQQQQQHNQGNPSSGLLFMPTSSTLSHETSPPAAPSSPNHHTHTHHHHHHLGPTGNFDFALYMGQDERLMAYVASLDLPFAPLTVTTALAGGVEERGSEAGFSLPPRRRRRKRTEANDKGEGEDYFDAANATYAEDEEEGLDVEEGKEDESVSGVLEALKELVAFRRRDLRWGVPASVDI